MFNEIKTNMNVNMSGKEYIAYRESRRLKPLKLPKKVKRALPFFLVSFVGMMFIFLIIEDLTQKPTMTFTEGWYKAMPNMVNKSWNSIAKFTFLAFGPFIVVMIGLAWLLHGFGFLIFRG